jgi:hypothetical protein
MGVALENISLALGGLSHGWCVISFLRFIKEPWNPILRCEVFIWRHWCYINTSTVWWIAPYWNSIHAPSRHYFPQTILRNTNLDCKATTDWLIRMRLSQWPSSLHWVTELTKSLNHSTRSKFHLFPDIWHWNLSDITANVISIIKAKEYLFHVPIYHIFWELQVASSQNALQQVRWSKLPGLDPVSGSAMAAPFIRSSLGSPSCDGNSRTPPEIHEGPPNLAWFRWPPSYGANSVYKDTMAKNTKCTLQ